MGAGALARRAPCPPADTFVFNLALADLGLADLGLALTLPFWAAESALDSHWPFGAALCKAVLTATVLNVYASIFLVTALSVARYWVVAMATGPGTHLSLFWARTATLAVRAAAALATLPTAIFGAEGEAWGVRLLRFPSRYWLGAYQLRRVALTFVAPLGVISTSHLLLLAFLQDGGPLHPHPGGLLLPLLVPQARGHTLGGPGEVRPGALEQHLLRRPHLHLPGHHPPRSPPAWRTAPAA